MSTKKLLTIAIPNYNCEENLKRALISCKNVNLDESDFEILVVDNCSTDNSVNIVIEMKKSISNIRLVKNKINIGRIGNWNKCLDEASGKYLMFLFSNEQIYNDNNISKVLEEMDKNNCGIAISPFIKEKNNEVFIEKIIEDGILVKNSIEFSLEHIRKFQFPFAPIQKNIYNMDTIIKNKIRFNEEYDLNGDQYFSFDICFNSKNIILNSKPQVIWIFNDNRFHSKITINKVITDDLNLIETLSKKYNLTIDTAYILAIAFIRTIYNKEWNNSDRQRAIKTIINKSKGKRIRILNIFLKKVLKKIKNIL